MTRNQGGFSLIEAIIVIVLLGAGMATILSMLAGGSRDVGLNSDTQIAARLMQEQIEEIVTNRRNPTAGAKYGYAGINTTTYPTGLQPVPGYAAFNRQVLITTTGAGGCPAAGQCSQVEVRVTRISDGARLAGATMLFTNY
jgi:type II secretory pathway pseudopilin PulG